MFACGKLCTVCKMWLGWVEHQHGMSLSVASSARNLGFPCLVLCHSVVTCMSPLAGCTASPSNPQHGDGNLPDTSTPRFSTRWKCCVSPSINITYHPKAPCCFHGVVFHGLSESQIPGLENPMWNLRSGGTLEMRWLNPPFLTPNGMCRNSLPFLTCLWRHY